MFFDFRLLQKKQYSKNTTITYAPDWLTRLD